MKIVGINDVCKNDQMADQLKKIYHLKAKRCSWPRKKGPAGTRVDVSTGKAVAFVR